MSSGSILFKTGAKGRRPQSHINVETLTELSDIKGAINSGVSG